MNTVVFLAYAVFLSSIVLTAVSSVMLKVSALREHPSRLREYLNPLVVGAYLMQSGAVAMTIFGYRYVPLSTGQVLVSSGQVLVMVLCRLVLHEQIRLEKWIGLSIIFAGIFVATLQ